jgi:hypothetical protein
MENIHRVDSREDIVNVLTEEVGCRVVDEDHPTPESYKTLIMRFGYPAAMIPDGSGRGCLLKDYDGYDYVYLQPCPFVYNLDFIDCFKEIHGENVVVYDVKMHTKHSIDIKFLI